MHGYDYLRRTANLATNVLEDTPMTLKQLLMFQFGVPVGVLLFKIKMSSRSRSYLVEWYAYNYLLRQLLTDTWKLVEA